MIRKAVLVLLLKAFSVITAQTEPPTERDVDAGSLSGGQTTICLPDENGRVGATDGESSVILYAFGMETLKGSSIDDVLYSFKTNLQMYLIEEYLPEDCITIPTTRMLQEQGVVGFRFDEDLDDISVECQPKSDPEAYCGIYEGVVHVFGSGGDVLSKIDEFVASVDPLSVHQRLVRSFPAGNSEAAAVDSNSGSVTTVSRSVDYGLSIGGAIGIIVTLMALLIGVGGFVYFKNRRHAEEGDASTGPQLQNGNVERLIDDDDHSLVSRCSLPSLA